MKFAATILLLCVTGSATAAGSLTECKMGSKLRQIEVVHQDNDAKKACDVRYTKEGADAVQKLWSYQNKTDQCAIKAQEFARRLTGFGWTCAAAPVK